MLVKCTVINGNGIEHNDNFTDINTINSFFVYTSNNIHDAIEYVCFHKNY